MTSATDKILARIDEEMKKRGDNPRFFELLHGLFSIQSETEGEIGEISPALDKEELLRRQESGRPLLGYEDLNIDWPLLEQTYKRMADLFGEYTDLFGKLSSGLEVLARKQTLSPATVRGWYEEGKLPAAVAANLREYLVMESVIQSALRPFLVMNAAPLLDSIEQEKWRRVGCPVCGGKPDFAYLDEERSARWLVCSRCDTAWIFQRLQCPFCGSEEQTKLGYSTDEDEIYRLYTCEECHRYLKAVNLKNLKSPALIPLERLLTLDLDRQAQEKGYRPGSAGD